MEIKELLEKILVTVNEVLESSSSIEKHQFETDKKFGHFDDRLSVVERHLGIKNQ
jgi:hypothetical protein